MLATVNPLSISTSMINRISRIAKQNNDKTDLPFNNVINTEKQNVPHLSENNETEYSLINNENCIKIGRKH